MGLIDKQRVRQDFSKASKSYDAAAVVQNEICNRALQRLKMLNLQPNKVLDIGCGTGRSVQGLRSIYSNSQIIASDISLSMLLQGRCFNAVCCDAEHLPVKDESIDLIFSTSTFQWCEALHCVFKECMRVMQKNAVLTFTTFGPDTLKELRNCWAEVDTHTRVHRFIDMHDIGDILLTNKFVDPVVDREEIVIEYQNIQKILKDLKATGSQAKFNSDEVELSSGLTGKKKFRQLEQAYEQYRQENGLLPVSYEVIYGYARKPSTNVSSVSGGEVKIPIDQIR